MLVLAFAFHPLPPSNADGATSATNGSSTTSRNVQDIQDSVTVGTELDLFDVHDMSNPIFEEETLFVSCEKDDP